MNASVSIALFCDPSETPHYYWVTVTTGYDPAEAMVKNGGHVTFVATTNAAGNYELDLLLESVDSSNYMECPVIHYVELGNLSSTGSECGVDIDVLVGNERVGGGIPKLANATQVERPVRQLA